MELTTTTGCHELRGALMSFNGWPQVARLGVQSVWCGKLLLCCASKKCKSNQNLLTWQLMLLVVIMTMLVVMREEMTMVEQPKTMIDEIP